MSIVACLLTGRERAAIATIHLRGPAVAQVISENFSPAGRRPSLRGEVRFGTWHGGRLEGDGVLGEAVVVVAVDIDAGPPHSTLPFFKFGSGQLESGQEGWEIHCHGGQAAAQRILDDLHSAGCQIETADTWQYACEPRLLINEATSVLKHCSTTRSAAIVLDQVRAAMLDFANRLLLQLGNHHATSIAAIQTQAKAILRFGKLGNRLSAPWNVVIAGPPNVGKSSLINALVGFQRSITMDQPGTTRDVLQTEIAIDGWPVVLSDTAGIRAATTDGIEQQGIERARLSIKDADLVVWVDDAGDLQDGDFSFLPDRLGNVLRVINKIDLINLPNTEHASSSFSGSLSTSATHGIGIAALRNAIVENLVPVVPEPGTPVPINDRQHDCLYRVSTATDVDSMRDCLQELIGTEFN